MAAPESIRSGPAFVASVPDVKLCRDAAVNWLAATELTVIDPADWTGAPANTAFLSNCPPNVPPNCAIETWAISTRALALIAPKTMLPRPSSSMSWPVKVPVLMVCADSRPISVCDARLPAISGPPDRTAISYVSPATVEGLTRPALTLPIVTLPSASIKTLAPVWIGLVAKTEPLECTPKSRPATMLPTVISPMPATPRVPTVLSSETNPGVVIGPTVIGPPAVISTLLALSEPNFVEPPLNEEKLPEVVTLPSWKLPMALKPTG